MESSLQQHLKLALAAFLLSACNTGTNSNRADENIFVGNYKGTYENSITTVSIKAENQIISGTFNLDNDSFLLNGTSNENTFAGEIVDEKTGTFHKIIAQIVEDVLYMRITFPEHNYQVLEIALNRTTEKPSHVLPPNPTPVNYEPKKRNGDNALVGKWRFTESFSSGSGGFYASVSTDYFMRINADGTAATWIGQSAGGSDSMIIEGNYASNAREFGWYTKGNQFFMVDPSHNEADQSVEYYAESNRMMISNGNDKRVWERVE